MCSCYLFYFCCFLVCSSTQRLFCAQVAGGGRLLPLGFRTEARQPLTCGKPATVGWEGWVMDCCGGFPECYRILTGVSPPEFRQNVELEHLEKGINHNSALPQRRDWKIAPGLRGTLGLRWVAPLVWRCLSNAAAFALRAIRRVKDRHTLLRRSPRLTKTCVREVVLDKCSPWERTGKLPRGKMLGANSFQANPTPNPEKIYLVGHRSPVKRTFAGFWVCQMYFRNNYCNCKRAKNSTKDKGPHAARLV